MGSPLLLSTAKEHKMKRILGSIVDIRKGEFALTFLMFIYYYLVLVAYYFLKPARDGLFLVRIGPEQLPIVFILIALVALPMITLYVRLTRVLKLTQLMNATTAVLIASLLILRWLIQLDYSWVYYVFYIWVAIYGITITSQFWLLANTVFNPAQAKRLFVLLNLGGIFGAFTGGEVTSLVVRVFGIPTENLLFLCIGFLTICIFLLNIIWTIRQKESQEQPDPVRIREQRKETLSQMFRTIRRSRQLMLIVGIISLMVMTASFVDFQFKTISAEKFPAKEDLTSFLGKFYGRLSLVALLFQSLFTYRFLRVLGVGGTIMFLPVGLLLGSVGMLMAPGLWAGIFLRGVDRSLGYSINKTGFELLSLPVPMEIKKRTKIFIDVFVERWSRGIAGALFLLLPLFLDSP